MDWHGHVKTVKPHVVRIETPDGYGTGFLRHRKGGWLGISTARHVIAKAHKWEQPIKVYHASSKVPAMLRVGERIIAPHSELDVAMIVARDAGVLAGLPQTPIALHKSQMHLVEGVAVGWLGFPHLVEDGTECCFFSGNISAFRDHRYFVDGVAIQGVSGGPAFCTVWDDAEEDTRLAIIGSISAYRPNRATGDALPGLLIADDVSGLHNLDQLTQDTLHPQGGQP